MSEEEKKTVKKTVTKAEKKKIESKKAKNLQKTAEAAVQKELVELKKEEIQLKELEGELEDNHKKFQNIAEKMFSLKEKHGNRQKKNGFGGGMGGMGNIGKIFGQDPRMWMQILIGVTIISIGLNMFSGEDLKTLPISEFQTQLQDGDFSEVSITGDMAIGKRSSGEKISTVIGERDSFKNLGFFDQEKIGETKINIVSQTGTRMWMDILMSFLPLLLLIGLMVYSMKGLKGGMGGFPFGGKQKGLEPLNPETTFDNVAGNDEPKYELKEIVEFLKSPEDFTKMGAKIPKGVLLSGPPGTGKTLLARAVAGESEVPFFSIAGSEFVEMFVGVGASRVRKLFDNAREQAPSIIFIDEIDAIGGKRSQGVRGGHSEQEQTLNQILTEMDGFENETGVIVIAATNRVDMLDSALLRPGRFDRRIVVSNPTIKDREAILKVHTKGKPMCDKVDLGDIAARTAGFSGADLENLLNEAAIYATRAKRTKIEPIDIDTAMDRITMGTEKKSLIMSDKEKEMTAYHEVGHAMAAQLLPTADPVHKITIVPRGQTLGATHIAPDTESYHTTKKQYFEEICVLLGGMSAEKIIFDDTTSGVSNDLERASRIANAMVMKFGMSDSIGPIVYSSPGEESFAKPHSEEFARKIDEEVQNLVKKAFEQTQKILTENIDLLHKISKSLIKKETLDRKQFEKFFGKKKVVKK